MTCEHCGAPTGEQADDLAHQLDMVKQEVALLHVRLRTHTNAALERHAFWVGDAELDVEPARRAANANFDIIGRMGLALAAEDAQILPLQEERDALRAEVAQLRSWEKWLADGPGPRGGLPQGLTARVGARIKELTAERDTARAQRDALMRRNDAFDAWKDASPEVREALKQVDNEIRSAYLDRLNDLTEAAQQLVQKLQRIHADPRYQAVWTIAVAHGVQYRGETYEAELNRLAELVTPPAEAPHELLDK